ncbi:helix-turn-helix domain-containing protein [Streptomyces sp. NBC_01615]
MLDAFVDAPDTLRLTDIARRTGLPLPTALRMVRVLVA